MSRDPDTIEREIERARDALAATLDEIGTRASPQRAVDSGKRTVQNLLADPKVRAALVGVGVLVGVLVIRKIVR